jgi:hypothetical protein
MSPEERRLYYAGRRRWASMLFAARIILGALAIAVLICVIASAPVAVTIALAVVLAAGILVRGLVLASMGDAEQRETRRGEGDR